MIRKKPFFLTIFTCFILFLSGFLLFYYHVIYQTIPTTLPPTCQAIIVLTGGSERIHISLEILKKNPHLSLLISGVDRHVSLKNIINHNDPNFPTELLKNITLGTHALSTIGNAYEANEWLRKNTFKNIILVTSNYHMPRALLEFKQNNPHLSLIAYPVQPNISSFIIIFHEYIKFILASFKNIILHFLLAHKSLSDAKRTL